MMAENKIIQCKTIVHETYRMICVSVLGAVDDWAAYKAREDAVLKVVKETGDIRVDEWVVANGLKMFPSEAAFVFPVMNPKRYRE